MSEEAAVSVDAPRKSRATTLPLEGGGALRTRRWSKSSNIVLIHVGEIVWL